MTFNYGLTVVPVLTEIFQAPPIIRVGAHLLNLAANFFPKVLYIGNTKLENAAEQDKLARIQTIVDELRNELDMKEMQVEVRVSPYLKDRISYLGNANTVGGALLLVGQKAFDEFESEKITDSSLYKEWQSELEKMPNFPTEIRPYLTGLGEEKKQRILNLAAKFEHSYTQKEFKAILARELSNIHESRQIHQTGIATHHMALFKILRTILPYAIPAAMLYVKPAIDELFEACVESVVIAKLVGIGLGLILPFISMDTAYYLKSSFGILGANFFAFNRINRSIKSDTPVSEATCFKTEETAKGILDHYKKLLLLHSNQSSINSYRFNLWLSKFPPQKKVKKKDGNANKTMDTKTDSSQIVILESQNNEINRVVKNALNPASLEDSKKKSYNTYLYVITCCFPPLAALENLFLSNKTYLKAIGAVGTSYQILSNLAKLNAYSSRLMSTATNVFRAFSAS